MFDEETVKEERGVGTEVGTEDNGAGVCVGAELIIGTETGIGVSAGAETDAGAGAGAGAGVDVTVWIGIEIGTVAGVRAGDKNGDGDVEAVFGVKAETGAETK